MSNPVGPEKPDLAAQAEAVFRDDPVAVLRAFANEIAKLDGRILLLERKLEAHLDATRATAQNPFTSD